MTEPAVVALGGGHGLAATLSAARVYAGSIAAIVSVADDGGSSGRLREAMPDLPAPGDVRRCLSALADRGSALARTLEHRFDVADGGLSGHTFGNLLLAALTDELGSFSAAVDEVARLVGAVGRVLPATIGPVALEGRRRPPSQPTGPPTLVVGQVAVQNAGGVSVLSLDPARAASPAVVTEVILGADQVVIGPGSLFTSVLAAAIVPDVLAALVATHARRVYVANLAPQVPETQGFDLADHVEALRAHGVPVDVVLCDDHACGLAERESVEAVPVVARPLSDDRGAIHHPERLAAALATLV
ncbi:MAG: uridine diphosphate-N-acetylglucosamine-binding protein YvcK [Acidimicrobiia bacterium]|nr:uridine diphosphate-N-acetylglucosamine-binding protein YvcK [Acidimicrobiia bacterium]